MYLNAEKRFSPLKFTKSEYERSQVYSPNKKNDKLQSDMYYCHYSNGHYMGGINSFKKHGKGIMLLDDGASAITQYSHDSMVGHNVVFCDDLIISIDIAKNRSKNVCYRYKQYVLSIPYNNTNQKEGTGVFVDFQNKKAFWITYHRNKLIKKIKIQQSKKASNILTTKDLSLILSENHIKALNLKMELPSHVHLFNGNSEYIIGFASKSTHKGLMLNGLAFKLKNTITPSQNLDINIIERGYYQNSKIVRFGDKHFSNGNFYIGEFLESLYHGKGVLVTPKQKKWTSGSYEIGKLLNVDTASVDGKKKWTSVVKNIHEKQPQYIQSKICLGVNRQMFEENLRQTIQMDPYEADNNEFYRTIQKNSENLKTIQEDFTSKQYTMQTQTAINQMLSEKKRGRSNQNEKLLNSRLQDSPNKKKFESEKIREEKYFQRNNGKQKDRSYEKTYENYGKIHSPDRKISPQKKFNKSGAKKLSKSKYSPEKLKNSRRKEGTFYRSNTTYQPVEDSSISYFTKSKASPASIRQTPNEKISKKTYKESELSRSRSKESSLERYNSRVHKPFRYLDAVEEMERRQKEQAVGRNIERYRESNSAYRRK